MTGKTKKENSFLKLYNFLQDKVVELLQFLKLCSQNFLN